MDLPFICYSSVTYTMNLQRPLCLIIEAKVNGYSLYVYFINCNSTIIIDHAKQQLCFYNIIVRICLYVYKNYVSNLKGNITLCCIYYRVDLFIYG